MLPRLFDERHPHRGFRLRAAAGLVAIALIAMGLVIGACILGASASAVSLGGVPLFGGLGLVVGVALAIYVFVKIRPYLK